MELNKEWAYPPSGDFVLTRLKYCFKNSISGEVIDKSWWNQGEELLYTCQETPIFSNFDKFPKRKRTKKNQLLLTRNATPYIFIPKENSIYSNVVQKIEILPKNDLRFIKYSLECAVESQKVNGDTIPSWNMDVWSNLYLPLFNIEKQKQIVEFLDDKCENIDKIINCLEKQVVDLEKYRCSIIYNVLNNSQYYSKQCRLKDVLTIRRGLFNHRPRNDSRYYGGIYPFIQTGDIAQGGKYLNSYSQTLSKLGTSASRKFKKGTLVLTIAANVGDVSILNFDAYFPDSVLGMMPKNGYCLDYLYYLVFSLKDEFVGSAVISTQYNLNIDRVANVRIKLIQNIEEQNVVANILNQNCSQIENLISIKKQKIQELKKYKKSLIYEYVTGKKEII